MSMPTIIASNQTGGDILLTRLGLTVPGSGTLTMTNFATVNEILDDSSLESEIDSGNILLDLGNGELNQGDSLKLFHIVSQEVRISVRGMSTTDETLSGTTTVDTTVSLGVDDRVLLTGQSTASENGIWVVKAGAWARPEDFATGSSAAGALVFIQEGTIHASELWACTTLSGSDVVGTNTLAFAQKDGSGGGGVNNLQEAYEGGNTIGVTAAEGNLAVTLTSADFTIDGANDLLVGGTTPLAIVNVDTGLMSLDSTDTTNLTMTANDGGDKTLTIAVTNAGGGDGLIAMSADGEIDIDAGAALSLNSSGGAINVGDDAVAQAINIGTGAAARTISIGNATSTTQLDLDSGTGGTLIDSTGVISLDGVGASNFTTDTGDLTLATTTSGAVNISSVGAVDVQAATNVTIDSSGGDINLGTDADTGAINIGTAASARTITIGNNTGATGVAIETGTGDLLIDAPVTTLTGDLVVQGTTTTVDSETVLVADNHLYLNNGYTTASAQTGGLVVNYLPTATADTVNGVYTAGVDTTSDPTVVTTGTATFAQNDLIQISGSDNNDGIYEVHDHTGTTLTIRSTANGVTDQAEDFSQDQFVAGASDGASITKVTVSVLRAGTDGIWETGSGDATSLTFSDITTSATLSLQTAYDGGNTITTAGGTDVVIAGTDGLQITGSGGLDVDTVADFDVTAFDVQMTGNNGFSLDGTADSNVTATNTAASTNVTLTVEATNTGATAGDSLLDINATSTNGTGTIELDADDTIALEVGASGAINIGTDAAVSTTTIGNNTSTSGVVVNSGTEQVEVDGVTYYGAGAGPPTATTSGFQNGDKFFDTDLEMEMRYDSTRSKWLSVEAMYIQYGRNGNNGVGVYYRGIDGRVMSSTNGYHMPYDGTVVGLGYTRDDTDSATFDVVEGGTSRATLASTAVSGRSNALDGDFSQGGVLAVVNQAGGNTTTNVMGWVKVKFRSS